MPEDDKAKARSVSLSPELWDAVDAIVDARYHGIRSRYFQEIVTADLKRRQPIPETLNESALEDLAEVVASRVMEKLEARTAGKMPAARRSP